MKTTSFLKLFGFTFAIAGLASVANANTGTFGYGIELLGVGASATNNGVTTLYALDQGGGSRLTPSGSTSTLNNSWTGASSDQTVTFSLGSFTPRGGDTLTLIGGSLLTFENSGDFQTTSPPSQYLNYRVAQNTPHGAFATGVGLTTTFFNVNGTQGDDRWSNETQSTNLLSGLTPGNYILSTYGFSGTDGSTSTGSFDSNNSNNYAASFTVLAPVPETNSTLPLLLGSAALLVLARRRSVKAAC